MLSISTSFQRFSRMAHLVAIEFPSVPQQQNSFKLNMDFTSTLTPQISSPFTLKPSKSLFSPHKIGPALGLGLTVKAQTLECSASFLQGGFGTEDEPHPAALEGPQCPPGLRKYQSMVLLRPDMSEDDRFTLTHKYEELLVAGGGMYVDVFHKGVVPLAYSIKKKNKAGETNTYLDASLSSSPTSQNPNRWEFSRRHFKQTTTLSDQ